MEKNNLRFKDYYYLQTNEKALKWISSYGTHDNSSMNLHRILQKKSQLATKEEEPNYRSFLQDDSHEMTGIAEE